MAQHAMKLLQFPVADQCADLLQHNQTVSGHHCPQQLHSNPLKHTQPFNSGIRRYLHSNLFEERLQLPVQQLCVNEFLLKSMAHHKHIVCDRHRLHQRTFGLDNADSVVGS